MNRFLRVRLPFAFVIAWLAACGSGDGGTSYSVPPEVEAALTAAGDPVEPLPVLAGSGSAGSVRDLLPVAFPQVQALIDGGDQTGLALRDAFAGTPDGARDLELAILAYALEKRAEPGAEADLRAFLGRNLTGAADLSLQFAGQAVLALSGAGSTAPSWLDPVALRTLADGKATSALVAAEGAILSTDPRNSCWKRMRVIDPATGQPFTFIDPKTGATKDAVVSIHEFKPRTLDAEEIAFWKKHITDGNGTPGASDGEFGPEPTWEFNCAGYAFREFNGAKRGVIDPDAAYQALVLSGAMEEVPAGQEKPGDKVFYWRPGNPMPGHAAEVASTSGGITVRNADNRSGLWTAAIDAKYYYGNLITQADYVSHKVYRWKGGTIPPFIADPAYATSADNCANVPENPTGGCTEVGGCDTKVTGHIFLGTTPAGETGPLGMGLYDLDWETGISRMITAVPIDGLAVSPDGTMLAAGILSANGSVQSDPHLAIYDVASGDKVRDVWGFADDTGPQQYTGPAWLKDGRTIVLTHVDVLVLYDFQADKGSHAIGRGTHSTASTASDVLVVEGPDGIVAFSDANTGPHKDWNPWDLESHMSTSPNSDVDPAKYWTVAGAKSSWRKPRFSPDGQRLLFLDSENREAVVIASAGPDAKSAGSLAWASGGGSPVVAATFSPDGKYVAWAVGQDKDAGGGVWVAPVASPTTPKRIFKADLRTLWNCDLAWAK